MIVETLVTTNWPGPIQIAPEDELLEIVQNVRMILTTPKGSVPLDRDFGLDFSLLDQPMPRAQALLAVEMAEQVARYEPRADVTQVDFEASPAAAMQGQLLPIVRIKARL